MSEKIKQLMKTLVERNGSDLHLTGNLWAYDVHKKAERNTYLKLLIEDKLRFRFFLEAINKFLGRKIYFVHLLINLN